MTESELTEILAGWKGYVIESVERHEENGRPQLWLYLRAVAGVPMVCSGGGERRLSLHNAEERWIRELPILDAECWLSVPRRRVAFPKCGPKVEQFDLLARYSSVTQRVVGSVARMCQILPVKQGANYYGLSWGTVRNIDKTTLEEENVKPEHRVRLDELCRPTGH